MTDYSVRRVCCLLVAAGLVQFLLSGTRGGRRETPGATRFRGSFFPRVQNAGVSLRGKSERIKETRCTRGKMMLVLTLLLTAPLVLCQDSAGSKPHLLFALVDGQSRCPISNIACLSSASCRLAYLNSA